MYESKYMNIKFSHFQKDVHEIYHGDALQVLREAIPDGSVSLVFADPPYNIGKRFNGFIDRWPSDEDYAKWCEEWISLCIRKLASNGSMYLMTSTQCMPYLDLFLRKHMTILSRIVWHYDSSGVQARKYFGSLYEPILFAVKDRKNYTFNADAVKVKARTGSERKLIDYRKPVPTVYNSEKVPGNVWYFSRVRYRMAEYEEHPSQKPETLLERIILASTNPGDSVLDPFSGTFTTCAVAKRLGRLSIGIEKDEEYVKVGLRRMAIQSTYNGEPLCPPQKSTKRKNGFSAPLEGQRQPELFEM